MKVLLPKVWDEICSPFAAPLSLASPQTVNTDSHSQMFSLQCVGLHTSNHRGLGNFQRGQIGSVTQPKKTLFEVIKRLQANNELDGEYFEMITKEDKNEKRLKEILDERTENAKIVSRLLEQLKT